MFGERHGAYPNAQIADRTRLALDGIPKALAAIKRMAESMAAEPDLYSTDLAAFDAPMRPYREA